MKKSYLLLLIASLLGSLGLRAEEFPDVYLRGDVNGWAVSNDYRFACDNGRYTLHLDHLEGAFKIATEDWSTVDLGASAEITGVSLVTLEVHGANMKANVDNVDLKFTMTNGQVKYLEVWVNGVGPEIPDPVSQQLSGTLPVLYINVYTDETHQTLNDEIISMDLDHKNYFSNSEYWLDMTHAPELVEKGWSAIGSKEEPMPLEIKARGNWTRIGFSKKPFKLKLGKKQSMLGMTKSKHYAILAHADDDKGYLKNFVGFNLGKRIGLPWTPDQQPIEVVINGDYRGLYFLTESIRIGDDRIMIESLDDNCSDPALASGGYLVELDNYDEVNQISMKEKTCVDLPIVDLLRVTWDTPEEYSDLQKQFITDQFTAMNNLVGANSDDLYSYMDLDDAVRYYLVEEIISHVEAYHGSTYLFRDRGENQKWHFSPLWDCGNAFNGPADGFFYHHSPFGSTWIPSMRENDKFNARLRETWKWFMSNKFNGIEDDIRAYVESLKKAAVADHNRWRDQPVPSGGQAVVNNSDMNGRMEGVLAKLRGKVNWLKTQFGEFSVDNPSPEPARDTTPAAPLPDYLSGVENVTVDNIDLSIPAEYFDLTGRKLQHPAPSTIVIERRGSSVRKVRF